MPGFIVSRATRAVVAACLLTTGLTGAVDLIGARAAGAATTTHYVAMGDSLGGGTGASPGSNAYVNRIYAHELARTPGLVLENFSCGGATTSSVINGPNCGSPTTQLATAEAFLKAHPGQVPFLTIDIGGNDVDGCGTNTTCLANGLAAINTNLPNILSRLKAAYPGIRVFGMNYYDPFLVTWLSGPSGQTQAHQSVQQADGFNARLANNYANAGFPTADPSNLFQTDDFALTGSYNGQTLPQNVANICDLTHMCESNDFHANNAGHAVLAQSFEVLIDTPGAPTAVSAAPGPGAAAIRWTVPTHNGGSAVTGYVITPFAGTTALAAHAFNTTATVDTIAGLTNGTSYTFKVAAKNALGTGPKSSASGPVTVGAPAPPAGVQAVSGTTATTTGPITVTYIAGVNHGAAITKYTATCTSSNGGVAKSAVHTGPTAGAITIAGATTAKSYACTVTATNGRGSSPGSVRSTAFTIGAPRAPVAPAVAKVGAGSLKVTFAAPVNNGAAITSYTAACASTNGGVAKTKTGAASPLTVTALTAGKTYSCTVSATNSRGAGPASPPSSTLVA